MVKVSIRADTSIGRKWDQYNKQNNDLNIQRNGENGSKKPNKLNKGPWNADIQWKKYLSIKLLWYCTTHPCIYHLCQLYMQPPPI